MKVITIFRFILVLMAEKNPKWDVLSEVLNEINYTDETLKIGYSKPGKLFTELCGYCEFAKSRRSISYSRISKVSDAQF